MCLTDLRILSLGAGVQSSTVALMMQNGLIKRPDAAIFADTHAEPKYVYEWLEWLKTQLSFPVLTTTHGSLKAKVLDEKAFISIPIFSKNQHTGKKGLMRRQCTREYKITPVNQKVRELLGLAKYKKVKPGTEVEMIMGISLDEVSRMATNQVKYIKNVYPLIDMKMRRTDCIEWMEAQGYPKPPRSACTFCPFNSDESWKAVKSVPSEWEEVLKIDESIRNRNGQNNEGVQNFLHKSCKPLNEVDFDKPDDQINMFENECTGGCGV